MYKILKMSFIILLIIMLGSCESETAGNNTNDFKVLNAIEDEYLKNDLINALAEINVDLNNIEKIDKTDGWINGDCYKISYSEVINDIKYNCIYKVYCNSNSTVESINTRADDKIYKRGYISYDIHDFMILNTAYYDFLKSSVKEVTSVCLKYPNTAEYSLSWSFSRNHNIYKVATSVSASNAFGVYEKHDIYAEFFINPQTEVLSVAYFQLGTNEYYDNRSKYALPVRETCTPKYPGLTQESLGIVLKYGELGEFGKSITYDGFTSISYFLPEGKYKVTNNSKMSTVFVASDNYHKNSDGYMENDILVTYRFLSIREVKEVTVPKGYHIEISMYTSVSFELILEESKEGNQLETIEGNLLKYELLEDGTYAITGIVELKSTNITIPNNVSSIGEFAFEGCNDIISLKISKSVKSIEFKAFHGCNTLTTITFEENSSLTSIGVCAFGDCSSLQNILIPEGVTIINDSAFICCLSLISIVIPDSVISMGEYVFSGCSNLKNITFGENSQLKSIGDYAFVGCSSLTSIEIPNSVTSIGDFVFYSDTIYRCDNLKSVIFRKNSQLKSIGIFAFSSCHRLTNIKIPCNVTNIGQMAFYDCRSLKSIEIPNSVISIGESAFLNCKNLKTIFYLGTNEQWNSIEIDSSFDSITYPTIYYYSKIEPTNEGSYWHYDVDGITPIIWQ